MVKWEMPASPEGRISDITWTKHSKFACHTGPEGGLQMCVETRVIIG